MLRLVIFLIWVVVLIVLIGNRSWWALAWLVATTPVLAWGVRRHQAVGQAAATATRRADIATLELAHLNHQFNDADPGYEFLDHRHPYALDLDLFGPGSLFQYVNRTVTAPGRTRLAGELLTAKNEEERARTRVQSKDLSSKPDWCVAFRTIGAGLNDDISYADRLEAWLDAPPVVTSTFDVWLIRLTPLFALAGAYVCLTVSPWLVGLPFFAPAGYLLRKYGPAIRQAHARTAATGELLKIYAALLAHVATHEPYAEVGRAEPALRRLGYYVSQLDVRYNAFAVLLEIGGAWSLRWLGKLDAWRAEFRHDLPGWLATLAEVDALVSWATLRFNHPGWTDAEFTDEPVLEGRGLAHPLIDPRNVVTNDLSIATDGHIHLVTGSNMAGKSTWLRTVGINLVLAQAGSSIPALHLRVRPLQLWTSMRTQDDLSESTSSFFAELKRLKRVIEAVKAKEPPVFFLLDEILKGTNSRDRHTGARALIRQLIRERGAGIIATHDLELAALENEPGSRVENWAMEVQTEGDDLSFDYKLRRGVCESFNATALMARMGIEIPEEEISFRHE